MGRLLDRLAQRQARPSLGMIGRQAEYRFGRWREVVTVMAVEGDEVLVCDLDGSLRVVGAHRLRLLEEGAAGARVSEGAPAK